MDKVKLRCFKEFAQVYPGVFNHPVYFTIFDGYVSFKLYTCINCGELFAIDLENPHIADMTAKKIAGDQSCPTCNDSLKRTLEEYPKTIRLADGRLGSFDPGNYIPPDDASEFLHIYEVKPN